MKALIRDMNITKEEKKNMIDLLHAIDRDVKHIFKSNEYMKNRFSQDYKRSVKDGSIIAYVLMCSKIIRALPKEGVLRSRLYSELVRLTNIVYKNTGNPRFKTMEKNLEEMMKKKVTVDTGRIHIEIKTGTLVKNQGNKVEFDIKNRNPIKINVEIEDISSENAKTSISGPRNLVLPPGSKGSINLIIEPSISGNIMLKSNLKISHDGSEKPLENYFEIPVIEEGQQEAAQIPKSPATIAVSGSKGAESIGADIDIEGMIRRAKANDWIKAIEDSVENDINIDLGKYSKGALAMYGERGYTNLLISAFMIDTARMRRKDVLKVFRGDAFTSRNMELLMDLSKKKELRFEAGSSDAGYIQEGLNIITGDFELPSKEKKRKKRWEILLPDNRTAVIIKEIIKDSSGRAKSIIFKLSLK